MTVSRVINGGYASAEVRARVQKAIKELGYAPSTTARSLRSGKKGCIGVSVESILGAWFMGLLAGIEQELNRRHVGLMLGSLRLPGRSYDASTVRSWIDGRRVDGLIMVRFTKHEQPLLEAADNAGIPVTFICPDQQTDSGFTVRCRNFEAGKLIGTHLLEQGHRDIAFIGGPRASQDSLERLRGLREVVGATDGAQLRPESVSFQSSYMPEAGRAAALEYLKLGAGQRPSAVVLGNDSMAISFMSELLRAGLEVPGQVSIAGFDGIEEGQHCWPALTTVAQPMQRLGSAACVALLDRIAGSAQAETMTAEFPMQLVKRESTGPFVRRSRAARASR